MSRSSLCPTASSRTYTWGLLPSEALVAHPMSKENDVIFRVENFFSSKLIIKYSGPYVLREGNIFLEMSLTENIFGTNNNSSCYTSSLCPTASSRTYTWGLLPSEALIAHTMKKQGTSPFRVEIFLLKFFPFDSEL